MSVKKLYSVSSKLKKYYHIGWRYKNASVYWCMYYRKEPVVNYKEVIKGDIDGDHVEGENVVDEHFTYEEALVLKSALEEVGETCNIEELELPIELPAYSCDLLYGDELTSINSFERLFPDAEKLPFPVVCYAVREFLTPYPAFDDYAIGCINFKGEEENSCICCENEIVANQCFEYRVVVSHYGGIGLVCDACAQEHAHKLYLAVEHFNGLDSKGYYLDNISAKQRDKWVGLFVIGYRRSIDNAKVKCGICEREVEAEHPYQIASLGKVYKFNPVCQLCVDEYVPELDIMLKQI